MNAEFLIVLRLYVAAEQKYNKLADFILFLTPRIFRFRSKFDKKIGLVDLSCSF
jgi:hypothetical protein